MTKARKATGKFTSEAEERAFWEREDSTADLDWPIRMWLAEKVG